MALETMPETTADLETREAVLILEGLDWQPACEIDDPRQHGPAEWLRTRIHRRCGLSLVQQSCEACRQDTLRRDPEKQMQCSLCGVIEPYREFPTTFARLPGEPRHG